MPHSEIAIADHDPVPAAASGQGTGRRRTPPSSAATDQVDGWLSRPRPPRSAIIASAPSASAWREPPAASLHRTHSSLSAGRRATSSLAAADWARGVRDLSGFPRHLLVRRLARAGSVTAAPALLWAASSPEVNRLTARLALAAVGAIADRFDPHRRYQAATTVVLVAHAAGDDLACLVAAQRCLAALLGGTEAASLAGRAASPNPDRLGRSCLLSAESIVRLLPPAPGDRGHRGAWRRLRAALPQFAPYLAVLRGQQPALLQALGLGWRAVEILESLDPNRVAGLRQDFCYFLEHASRIAPSEPGRLQQWVNALLGDGLAPYFCTVAGGADRPAAPACTPHTRRGMS